MYMYVCTCLTHCVFSLPHPHPLTIPEIRTLKTTTLHWNVSNSVFRLESKSPTHVHVHVVPGLAAAVCCSPWYWVFPISPPPLLPHPRPSSRGGQGNPSRWSHHHYSAQSCLRRWTNERTVVWGIQIDVDVHAHVSHTTHVNAKNRSFCFLPECLLRQAHAYTYMYIVHATLALDQG